MSYHFSRFNYQVTLEYYYDKHHKLRIKKGLPIRVKLV